MRSERRVSFGENYRSTLVDRFGIWLSWRQIRRFIPEFYGLRLGDFGAGFDASLTRFLLPKLRSVVIVDLSFRPDLLQNPKIQAVLGTFPSVLETLPSESLDVIVCNSVLEHLWEPLETIGHIRRILAPGGRCLLNVPSWRGKFFLEFSAFHLGLSPAVEMDDHKMYYDPKDFWPLLVRAGFKPSRIQCFRHKFGMNTFASCLKEE